MTQRSRIVAAATVCLTALAAAPVAAQRPSGAPSEWTFEACLQDDCGVPAVFQLDGTASVPKFDPAWGTLLEVELVAELDGDVSVCFESVSNVCCAVQIDTSLSAGVTPGATNQPPVTGWTGSTVSGTTNLLPPGFMFGPVSQDTNPGDCAGADGTCAGGNGYQASVSLALASVPLILQQPADLAPWVLGSGTPWVTVEGLADGSISTSSCGNSFSSSDMRGTLVLRVTYRYGSSEVGASFCPGDGSGAPCPCGNGGLSAGGCRNSLGLAGALIGGGSASVAADDLAFTATSLVPGEPTLLFAGPDAMGGGAGLPFGDGLRCVGGSVRRLGVRFASAATNASWGPGLAAAAGWSPGRTVRFQAMYRDTAGSPCGAGFNLSQGVRVDLQP